MREQLKRRKHARELLLSDQMPWHLQPAARGSQCAAAGSDSRDPPRPSRLWGREASCAQGKPRPSWGRAPERDAHCLNEGLYPLLPPQRLEPLTLCKKKGFPPGWGNALPHSIHSLYTPIQTASSHRGQKHRCLRKPGAKLNTKTEISL